MITKAVVMATIFLLLLAPFISVAQTSDEIFSNPSESSPFESGGSKSKSRSDDEIYYDTSKQVTMPFFDMTSGIGHPFGPTGGVAPGADPGDNPDAPFDDYLSFLFLIVLGVRFRIKIKNIFKNQYLSFSNSCKYMV